jgi:hypothetical protein
VAVQSCRDNSDEVTGATLNGGETGGTWTTASCWGPQAVSRRRAGHVRRRDADRRHESGDSVNPNSTTPVNAVSLTLEFFLRGKPV